MGEPIGFCSLIRHYERLAPHFEFMRVLGEALHDSGEQLKQVSLPTTAPVSLMYIMKDGALIEVAMIGNEGILGIASFRDATPSRASVQSAGHGYRLKAPSLKDKVSRAGSVMDLMLRYTQAWSPGWRGRLYATGTTPWLSHSVRARAHHGRRQTAAPAIQAA